MTAKTTKVALADRLSDLANHADLVAAAAHGEGDIAGNSDAIQPIVWAARELASDLRDLANKIALQPA